MKIETMKHAELTNVIKSKFETSVTEVSEAFGMLEITFDSEKIEALALFLKNELGFIFLTDLCGVHYPENQLPFAVVYHFHNLEKNIRIRIKTYLSAEPETWSLCSVFACANWMERETWDFYGIKFKNHPNLTRILNVEYLDYFPLRKEYPLEDPTREDKDDRYFGR